MIQNEHKYLIGLDNGGTVIKAVLFDTNGTQLKECSVKVKSYTAKPGYMERDMEQLWEANAACIKGLMSDSEIGPEQIACIGFSGHGKGLYLWGEDGPFYPGILSADHRAWEYPKRWQENGVLDEIYPQICQQLIAGQQVSLLAWLKDNEKAVYDQIKYVFSIKDYIRYRLTDEAKSEITDLSGSGLMNIRDKKIDSAILERLGIPEIYNKIPPLCRSDEICGYLTAQAAEKCGLKAGIPVSGGMFDIDACAIAMNVSTPESLCMITGTWSINEFISREPVINTEIAMNSIFAIPEYYLVEECSPTSAGNLEWILEQMIDKSQLKEGDSLYDMVNHKVDAISPQDCDLYFLPFLYGSNHHPLAKACFIGMSSYHTDGHLLRAVFEGVVYSAKTHLDKLLKVRSRPSAIRLAGGIVNSPVWVQIFADITGFPIECVAGVQELGALGAAMSAAVAGGIFADYESAAEHMVTISQPVYPNKERHQIYQKKYQKYCNIVNALETVWETPE